MKFSELGEFKFIERISHHYPSTNPFVIKGIGDDAAVMSVSRDSVILVTTDQLIEGFHFQLAATEGWKLGWKALAVNLSDVAAMGGTPVGYTLSLGIPTRRVSLTFLDEFYRGLSRLGKKETVALLGGDTSESGERLTISISVIGTALREQVVYRNGANDGDDIYVTGWLGDASVGLKLIERGEKTTEALELIERHLCPTPRTREGRLLAEKGIPTAMIDVSDGLLADLNHILHQSGLGAEIELSALPLSQAFRSCAAPCSADPLMLALGGGEDYELLFSASIGRREEIEGICEDLSCPITRIGRLSKEIQGILLKDKQGMTRKADPLGYDHFKTNRTSS
ncbi:MAG: thiamine-phosphate kinase [Deltaproteobacteria bacterium]|nr:thiamine-phosphate kinase [Deltaproteobacteria bacterium]